MAPRPDVPRTLLLAAVVVALEGLVLLVLTVAALLSVSGQRLGVALSVSAFFAICGAGLLLAGRALRSAEGWARGPALLTQLILLGIAWQVRAAAPVALIAALVVVALVGLAGLVHPATTARLARD